MGEPLACRSFMPLHDETLDKSFVLDTLDATVHALERDEPAARRGTCEALGIGGDEWAACRDALIEDLHEAEDWVDREDALVRSVDDQPPVDSDEGPEFLPSHQTLALFQSAMDEQIDVTPTRRFQPHDPQWISVLYQRLRARVRGKAPFVQHEQLDDFRVELPERGTVALVSDWGTGNAHAIAVARQIAARDPDHVVHLGDIYYAGTPREVQRNFLDVWRAHGPTRARYWTLNANHDMYSGGYGYFEHVLPAFGQPASYFSLRSAQWQLVGLDTGYVTHTFTRPQIDWLDAQTRGRARTILLTHHHLLSPFRKRGNALEEWLDPLLAEGRVYGWFWGHEHYLFEYADYRGVKCRCIGHGSLPYVPPDRRRRRHPVDIVRMETRRSPLNPARGIHGFGLLTFDGARLDIEFVDEEGGTSWTETWD